MAFGHQPRNSGYLLYEEKSFLWKISNYAQLGNWQGDVGMPFTFTMGEKSSSEIHTMQSEMPLLVKCNVAPVIPNLGITGTLCLHRIPPKLSQAQAKIHLQVAENYHSCFGYEDGIIVSLAKEHKFMFFLPGLNQEPELTADGALEIRIKITIYHHSDGQNEKLAAVETKFKDIFQLRLRYQLTTICEKSGDFHSQNIRIVSKDGGQFRANRNFLAARSPVFQGMFQSGMSEVQAGLVEVKDIDSKTLEVLLHFMRTGELRKNWKEAGVIEGLVYAAHKYMLEDLKFFLGKVLELVCTKENCGKLCALAKTFGMEKAEQQLLAFFKENLANSLEEVAKFTADMEMMAQFLALPSQEAVNEKQENGEKSLEN